MTTEYIIGTSTAIFDKFFKFEGIHFKHWQQKKTFLNFKRVFNILINDMHVVPSGSNE